MTQDDSAADQVRRRPARAQYVLAGVVVALAVAAGIRYSLVETDSAQSAAFYVGIPAVIALIVVFSAPGRSAVGIVLKTITILLLLSMMFLGEGFICVIFAAPIFYLVGGLVAVVVEKIAKSGPGEGKMNAVAVPALVLVAVAATEGIVPATTFDGVTTVSASRTLNTDAAGVIAAWERPLDFEGTPLPGVLSWGFPEPLADSGGTLEVGERRTVTFDGAHHRSLPVSEHHWGEHTSELTFEVVARTTDSARLAVVGDTTPISTWLTWNVADISWSAVDSTHTAVDLELSYTRELAPAWYFGPIEEYVTERAAGWLLDSLNQ